MTHPLHPELIDALAAIIRKVDGSNSLGAAALAEAIIGEYVECDDPQDTAQRLRKAMCPQEDNNG